ncbi:hypothetical protein KM043_006111 [Ampulex compressa]|nr:hypothetical protein KM043_006111 [Ampulex compressa]
MATAAPSESASEPEGGDSRPGPFKGGRKETTELRNVDEMFCASKRVPFASATRVERARIDRREREKLRAAKLVREAFAAPAPNRTDGFLDQISIDPPPGPFSLPLERDPRALARRADGR